MNTYLLFKLINIWPPYLGAGIRVTDYRKDFSYIKVQMKLRFWNKNYVGTHFGGSLYSMTDPFYMLMLMHQLGPDYIVWDKAATIRYKKPAKSKVYAEFNLTPEIINHFCEEVEEKGIIEPVFDIDIFDENNTVVASVEKKLHIQKKAPAD